MGWMADVVIESIAKDIDKKIAEIESLKDMNARQVKHVVKGLKFAKEIVEKHY